MSESLLSSLDSLSKTIFGNACCAVTQSDKIVLKPNFCKFQTGSPYFTLQILIHKGKPVIVFCYAATDWSIASLVFFPWFHLEVDSISALTFTDKMTKKLNCDQETTGTPVFYAPNSLPAPSLLEQSFSVANVSCSWNSTPPLPPNSKLQPPH